MFTTDRASADCRGAAKMIRTIRRSGDLLDAKRVPRNPGKSIAKATFPNGGVPNPESSGKRKPPQYHNQSLRFNQKEKKVLAREQKLSAARIPRTSNSNQTAISKKIKTKPGILKIYCEPKLSRLPSRSRAHNNIPQQWANCVPPTKWLQAAGLSLPIPTRAHR